MRRALRIFKYAQCRLHYEDLNVFESKLAVLKLKPSNFSRIQNQAPRRKYQLTFSKRDQTIILSF